MADIFPPGSSPQDALDILRRRLISDPGPNLTPPDPLKPKSPVADLSATELFRIERALSGIARNPDEEARLRAVRNELLAQLGAGNPFGRDVGIRAGGDAIAASAAATLIDGFPDGGLRVPPAVRDPNTLYAYSPGGRPDSPLFNTIEYAGRLISGAAEVENNREQRELFEGFASRLNSTQLLAELELVKRNKIADGTRDALKVEVLELEIFRRVARGEIERNRPVPSGFVSITDIADAIAGGLPSAGPAIPDTGPPPSTSLLRGIAITIIAGLNPVPPPGQQAPQNPMPLRPPQGPDEPPMPMRPPGAFPDDLFRRNPPDP